MTNRRRRLVAAIALGALATPLAVHAQQQKRVWRIGFATTSSSDARRRQIAALEQGLRDYGYAPGKDVAVEVESAGAVERMAPAIRSLVDKKVDVIVAFTNPVIASAREATTSIPIVMVAGTDVVRAGLVRTLARPGGNVTGLTWDVGVAVVAKRLALLKELAPRTTRVGVLWEPPYEEQFRAPTDEAAAKLGLSAFWTRLSANVQRDFAAMAQQRCDALFPHLGPSLAAARTQLLASARERRWPSAFPESVSVEAGGLMSYAPNIFTQMRSAARFVDRILKGASPADLPVEQPTVLEFVLNLKTAKALGLTIAHSLLLRADRVIE